jgi:outer membrane protein OmpA-like peptidoglycan-associated protein/tetratricopeptide (TPR) repeat protein
MSRIIIYIFCLLFTLPVLGQQRTEQKIAVGDDYYNKGQYTKAIDIYERILKRERNAGVRQELTFKMGDSYRHLLNYQEAKKWYVISLNLGYEKPDIFLHLSEMSLGLEEFDNSLDYIGRYLQIHPDDGRALKLHQSAYFAKHNYNTETIFEVSNESTLNTPGQQWGVAFLENSPIYYSDQAKVDQQYDIDIRLRYNNVFYWAWVTKTLKDRIVFSSTQSVHSTTTVQGYSNIFQATFNKRLKDWDTPRLLYGVINSSYYDGFLSYDAANEIAYFMNSGGQDGSRATSDIYISQYNTRTDFWGAPKLFDFNNPNYNIGYPSINETGDVLYFASDMSGGFGGYDIYKILKDENGNWGQPINLGPEINTPFNESYPYIVGDVLYFSSYGHPGFGGFDVFYSQKDENGNYSQPRNMGVPVNSSADDFGFIIDPSYSRGFFSSNRPGGKGEDDLYSFRVVSKTFAVKGRIIDEATGTPIAGLEIFFYDNNNNFFDAVTDINGFYDFPALSTDVNYYISAYPENYHELADTLAVKDQLLANRFEVISSFEKNFSLIPLGKQPQKPATPVKPTEVLAQNASNNAEDLIIAALTQNNNNNNNYHGQGSKQFDLHALPTPTIYFDFGRARLRPYSMQQLDSLVVYLKSNPDKGLVVNAHTDEISGYLFNFYLSQQRAQSVITYLKRQGIDPGRLYPKGHGKMHLAVRGATNTAEHQLNRRANFETIPVTQLNAFLQDASRHSFRYLNSINKEAHFAEGIEFMVQFMAATTPMNPQYYRKILDNIPNIDIIYYYDNDHYHRYLAGSFRDFESAFTLQRELRQLGYEIYIVAFQNGERIPVSRARRLTGEI